MSYVWTSQPSEAFGGSGSGARNSRTCWPLNNTVSLGRASESVSQALAEGLGLLSMLASDRQTAPSSRSGSDSSAASSSASWLRKPGITGEKRPVPRPLDLFPEPTAPQEDERSSAPPRPTVEAPDGEAPGTLREAMNMPPNSTFSSLFPACDGMTLKEAPTESPWVTITKLRLVTVLLLKYSRNLWAYLRRADFKSSGHTGHSPIALLMQRTPNCLQYWTIWSMGLTGHTGCASPMMDGPKTSPKPRSIRMRAFGPNSRHISAAVCTQRR
mmetsp:Transcript_170293/g.546224  ORF Transcript_170293/g.546224 Transcript_170293/m.546224 type:complete len:271 (+) Transcript_170293:1853-2665(+)